MTEENRDHESGSGERSEGGRSLHAESGSEQHRGAGAEDCGGAVGGAGDGTGAGSITSAVWAIYGAQWSAATYITISSGVPYGGPGIGAVGLAAQGPPQTVRPPPHYEDGGIVVGEITGWRIWRVTARRLFSYAMDVPWQPDEPMEGRPLDGYSGVYAFKTEAGMRKEFGSAISHGVTGPYVYGEVSLWGDVVEHEHGYRAQYGRVKRLWPGAGVSWEAYEAVCRTYGVEAVPKRELPKPKRKPWRLCSAVFDGVGGTLLCAAGSFSFLIGEWWMGLIGSALGSLLFAIGTDSFLRWRRGG